MIVVELNETLAKTVEEHPAIDVGNDHFTCCLDVKLAPINTQT